jgi:ribonuclease J
MSFAMKKQFYSPSFLSPKSEKESLQELGILPKIKGVYKFDPSPPEIDGVFISHGHFDHSAYLSFIKREIPAIAVKQQKPSCELLVISAVQIEFDVSDLNFESFRTGTNITVDNLEIEPVHVDHSVPGAYGFVVHTSSGSVA